MKYSSTAAINITMKGGEITKFPTTRKGTNAAVNISKCGKNGDMSKILHAIVCSTLKSCRLWGEVGLKRLKPWVTPSIILTACLQMPQSLQDSRRLHDTHMIHDIRLKLEYLEVKLHNLKRLFLYFYNTLIQTSVLNCVYIFKVIWNDFFKIVFWISGIFFLHVIWQCNAMNRLNFDR